MGLARDLGQGEAGIRAVFRLLRQVQLDPLDPMGTNQELVFLARLTDTPRAGLLDTLFASGAFEHYAKERCLLPAEIFPCYRAGLDGTWPRPPWWRLGERQERVPDAAKHAVREAVARLGPVTARELPDLGGVVPIDWSGWKGTSRLATMAAELLWLRCELVIAGRRGRDKLFDLPERALPEWGLATSEGPPAERLLVERVRASGLLSRAAGVWWSSLGDLRVDPIVDRLVSQGILCDVRVESLAGRWLCTPEFLEGDPTEPDARMRILGPLDPLLWNRTLVENLFGFVYKWEVYKPASARRWGWYVVPLLYRGELVGRIEAKVVEGRLEVDRIWREPPPGIAFPEQALVDALQAHARALGVQEPDSIV